MNGNGNGNNGNGIGNGNGNGNVCNLRKKVFYADYISSCMNN